MSVVIIDYGSGNLRSAAKAFERAAGEAGGDREVIVSADAKALDRATHIVLPGVGAFADCMHGLEAVPGMVAALRAAIIDAAKPFLGICVGMQLMADRSREHGRHAGLGWIPGEVVAMDPPRGDDGPLPIPHMGWNGLELRRPEHPTLRGIAADDHVYFVHGYHFVCETSAHLLATVDYGGPIAAIVGRDNMVGTQFHPEKSQAVGLRFITNFLQWRP